MSKATETKITEETVVQQKVTPTTKAVKKAVEQYIGPTIPGVAVTCTVYNNGIPKELQEEINKVPAIRSLIVPVTKLAAARKEINQKNSALRVCYEKVEQHIKQKGE